jgi:hypothetical protein
MECYIKEDVIKNNALYDIHFKNPHNFEPLENMYFEAVIGNCSLKGNILHDLKIKCLYFHIESIHQILLRFP